MLVTSIPKFCRSSPLGSLVRSLVTDVHSSWHLAIKDTEFHSLEKVDPLAQYYRRTQIGIYNVNFIKVGNGPHAVFCYPGLIGSMRMHLKDLVGHMEQHSDYYTFYAWDQPGFGQSRPPKRIFTDHSMQEDVDMTLTLLKELGHDKYSVLGWCGGGLSALLMATQHCEKIRKLVVWGVFSYVAKEDADKLEWFKNTENWKGKMQDAMIAEFGQNFFLESWQTWLNILQRIYTHHGGEFCAKNKITCPTFILHGSDDLIVHEKHAHFLHKHIANSRLMIMEGGKHSIHITHHQQFFDVVHNFLQEN